MSLRPPSPPRPPSRPEKAGWLARLRLFRSDMLSSQPERLYDALMAEMRSPLGRSVLVNDPGLLREVLGTRPGDFAKPGALAATLGPLLGQSVFVTNDETWARQRRMIDPAFGPERLGAGIRVMNAAAAAAVARIGAGEGGTRVEIEAEAMTAHFAADVMFRLLFSRPIGPVFARESFDCFRAFQRSVPLWSPADLLGLPRWVPRWRGQSFRQSAARLRALLDAPVAGRAAAIAAGHAPDDLATRILTARDPVTGTGFPDGEARDQVVLFFLAGHETTAAALSWALYLLATHPAVAERVAAEGRRLGPDPGIDALRRLSFTRDVLRETLRLYPPVPMILRRTRRAERLRGRWFAPGTLVILSPWHLHRHRRFWPDPDGFDPGRWKRNGPESRGPYMPFSGGPRVCPGAAFAMAESVLFLARVAASFRLEPVPGAVPRPVAQLTVRARDGIRIRFSRRDPGPS